MPAYRVTVLGVFTALGVGHAAAQACGTDAPSITLLGDAEVTLTSGHSYTEQIEPGYNVSDDLIGVADTWTFRTGWVGPCSPATFGPGQYPNDTSSACADAANCTCDDGNWVYTDAQRPQTDSQPGVYFKLYEVTDVPERNVAYTARRVTVSAQVSTGSAGCRCLNESALTTTLPIASYLDTRAGKDCLVVTNTTTGDQFCYPIDYGISGCKSYEEKIIPVCVDGYFAEVAGRPDWCSSPWCYVDPDSCDLGAFGSSFFSGMYYSYATCGPNSTYDEVHNRFDRQSGEASKLPVTTEMWSIIGLTTTLLSGAAVLAIFHVRTIRRKQRPADFRKIIAQLLEQKDGTSRIGFTLRRPRQSVMLEHAEGPNGMNRFSTFSTTDDIGADHSMAGVDNFSVPPELVRSDVTLFDVLGKGEFGQVFRGTWHTVVGRVRVSLSVAVKTMHDDTAGGVASAKVHREFLEESLVTWQFDHDNVIKMHGVVTSGFPHLLVLELCECGELAAYLKKEPRTSCSQRLAILTEAASGLAYLASRHFVHRDVAARNVLLDAKLHAKISDFGLGRGCDTKDYYRMSNTMMLPVRWTDPSVFDSHVFSEATDVWAFGITAIEVFQSGERPYGEWSNAEVMNRVRDGFRHPKPDLMPREVYNDIVKPCWCSGAQPRSVGGQSRASSWRRPTFEILRERLASLGEGQPDNIMTATRRRRPMVTLPRPPTQPFEAPNYEEPPLYVAPDMIDPLSRRSAVYEPLPEDVNVTDEPQIVYTQMLCRKEEPESSTMSNVYTPLNKESACYSKMVHTEPQDQEPPSCNYISPTPIPEKRLKTVLSPFAHLEVSPKTSPGSKATYLAVEKSSTGDDRRNDGSQENVPPASGSVSEMVNGADMPRYTMQPPWAHRQ